ncbi:MAG TPA: AAA family ATPase [Deferrisomatales bacterium]|nr:AAA family ATPase [Deferrisomatales bacterium]
MHLKRVILHSRTYPTAEAYPFNLALFRQTEAVGFPSAVTFFAGENGSGKTTFLEAVAQRCGTHIWRTPEGRRVERNPFEKTLHRHLETQWVDGPVPASFFSSQSHRDFSLTVENWAAADPGQLVCFGGRSLVTQSHGQSVMAFFRSRYRLKGLYFLDEPETALSPRKQVELLHLLQEMAARGHAQFLIATHSPILLACPGATIYSFDRAPLAPIEYEATEYYRIYRDFLNDRAAFLGDRVTVGDGHARVAAEENQPPCPGRKWNLTPCDEEIG